MFGNPLDNLSREIDRLQISVHLFNRLLLPSRPKRIEDTPKPTGEDRVDFLHELQQSAEFENHRHGIPQGPGSDEPARLVRLRFFNKR